MLFVFSCLFSVLYVLYIVLDGEDMIVKMINFLFLRILV